MSNFLRSNNYKIIWSWTY